MFTLLLFAKLMHFGPAYLTSGYWQKDMAKPNPFLHKPNPFSQQIDAEQEKEWEYFDWFEEELVFPFADPPPPVVCISATSGVR